MRTLIIYATQEGQTGMIAERIWRRLRQHGLPCDTYDIVTSPADEIAIDAYDAVIFGSALHYGAHDPHIGQVIQDHKRHLDHIPTGFFSVSLGLISKVPEDRQKVETLAQEFQQSLHWSPNVSRCFAGALRYSKYGPIKKRLMRWIAKQNDGDTDLTRDHIYTDWDAVDRFTDTFYELLRDRHGHKTRQTPYASSTLA
jgi:menaquinone-dependent protoporphyrinogen oxidase